MKYRCNFKPLNQDMRILCSPGEENGRVPHFNSQWQPLESMNTQTTLPYPGASLLRDDHNVYIIHLRA